MKHPTRRNTAPRLRPLALAIAALCLPPLAPAAGPAPLPSGLQLVQGQATLATTGNRLTVTNSANAILNWQQFSIGADKAVHFAQPGAASKVLNRVVGSDPSSILGSLSSNGQVWLLNPNGVLFGAGARVDVAGLVASTLRLGDADWMAGRLNLSGSADGAFGNAASVVNQGTLRTINGGRVMLIGSASVRNEGLIDAPDGQVLLAAGRSVELVDTGLPNLSVQVTAPQGEAVNLGTLLAGSGRIDLQAALVNQQGIVRADSLSRGRGGEVVLSASHGVELGAGSQTRADGAAGGQVSIDGGSGTTLVSGGVSALGSSGTGGGITLLGRQVGLLDGAVVDASGAAGGGAVRVGGGLQGRDAAYRNAEAVFMGPGATIAADATSNGDGGLVVLWSDNATRVYGALSARGGPIGGNGGFIETSGGWLDARPASVHTTAPAGRIGQWLLDPYDITIANSGSDQNIGSMPDFVSTDTPSFLVTGTLVGALETNDVTVTTGPGGSAADHGDITVSGATISLSNLISGRTSGRLTLTATRNINFTPGSSVGAFDIPLNLDLNAGGAVTISSSQIGNAGGSVAIRASSVTINASTIDTAANASPSFPPAVPSPGTILIAADSVSLGVGTQLRSNATGKAISLQGTLADTPMLSFANLAGASALQATAGRWQVHAADSAEASASFAPGGLVPDFWQYNATPSTTPAGTGDGFFFTAQPSLAVTGFQRVYDGTTTIDLSAFQSLLTGLRTGQSLVGAPSFSNGNAALAVPVVLAAGGQGHLVQTSGGTPVYGYQGTTSLVGDITRRAVSVTAVAVDNKTYDGNATATVNSWSLSNVISGDVVTASGGALFDTALAGSDIRVAATATSLGGTAAGNYSLGSASAIGSASISQRTLSVGGVSVANKVYDGSTVATVTDFSLLNVVAGDSVQALGTGFFDTAGVGNAKSVGATAVSLTGPAAANYNLDPLFSAAGGVASITARPLTMSNVVVADKVYDGGTAASVTSWTLSGVVGTEPVTTGPATGQFNSPGAGTGKSVLTSFSLPVSPTNANYVVADPAGSTVASITQRPLTLSGVVVNDKVYDGNTDAQVLGWTLANVVTGDQVQVGAGSGRFSSPTVAAAQSVVAVATSLTGPEAGNYNLVAASQLGVAAITQRPLTVAGVSVADKVYDGSSAATVTQITLANVVPGDQVQAGGAGGSFSSAGAGVDKPVFALAGSLTGSAAGNYRLDTPFGYGSASITPRPLTMSDVVVADKVYDGSTAASVSSWTLSNLLPNDQVNTGPASGQFSDAGVGSGKPVQTTFILLPGGAGSNYRVASPAGSGSASITPATALYLADPATAVQGLPLPALSGTVTGFVNGETLAGATTGSLRFDTPASTESAPGRYAIDGSGLAAANYRFAQAPGNATALALLAPPAPEPPTRTEPPINPYVTQNAVSAVLPVPQATSPASGRTHDAMPAVLAGGGDRPVFTSLDLGSLSPAAVASVLAARDEYKRNLFRQALIQLEQDPGRADATTCTSPEQANSGQCLITAPLASTLIPADARASAGAPGAVAAGSPAPAQPAAASPAPAAAVAAAAAAAARPVRPPQPVVDLPPPRGVTASALPQIQRKIAVVIGIDQYADARIPRLGNAVNDARAVAASLETHLGYETVVLANANRSGIYRALNQLASQVGPADSVIVYYAGHGERSEKSGLGYWQPSDADPTRPDTWISNADIDRLMRQLPASQVALISDSCFSGSLVAGERIRGATGAPDPSALLGRRAAVVMTSGGNEPVFDSGKNGHSPFAWSLMQSIRQVSTWKPGSSVFEQVRFAVARQLPQRPQYAAAPNAGHQAGADYLFEQRQLAGVVK